VEASHQFVFISKFNWRKVKIRETAVCSIVDSKFKDERIYFPNLYLVLCIMYAGQSKLWRSSRGFCGCYAKNPFATSDSTGFPFQQLDILSGAEHYYYYTPPLNLST